MPKASKYSEIEAMGDVDKAFSQLDEDARQRVMTWAASKYQLKFGKSSNSGQAEEQPPAEEKPPLKPKDVKMFMAQKKPENFYERVACLAYYLEKFDGIPEVKTEQIREANTNARMSRMTNPALFVKHATHTYGYLTSLGKRKFALSTRGEAVVDALPDRTKVQEAIDNNPFGKKPKRKAKPKK